MTMLNSYICVLPEIYFTWIHLKENVWPKVKYHIFSVVRRAQNVLPPLIYIPIVAMPASCCQGYQLQAG